MNRSLRKKEQQKDRLYDSAKIGDVKELHRLFNNNIDIHSDYDCAFVIAASENQVIFCKEILQLRANPRAHNHQALKCALESDNEELINLIVSYYND